MALVGWSVHGGDTARQVELQVRNGDAVQTLRYLPVDGSSESLPTATVAPEGDAGDACTRWIRKPAL